MKKLVILFLITGLNYAIPAQTIDFKERNDVVNLLSDMIREKYVYEDVAIHITDSLKLQNYTETNAVEFARQLTHDLLNFSHDKHFEVMYNEENDFTDAITPRNRKNNFGFSKLEILKGNIGFMELAYFEDPALAGKKAHAAMNFLSDAGAVIIDLRNNNGGKKAMVQLIMSYFFDEPSKHLYSIYGRKELFYGYTEVDLPGSKLANVPLYIIVNQRSFSAAEMFAFVMQMQERATIIGTKTAGGGHTVGNYPIGYGFSVNIPVGRVVDPGTQKGWEKVGIQPDIEVTNNMYEETAYLTALKHKIQTAGDSIDVFDEKWQLDILQSHIEPVSVDDLILSSYTGIYGRRIVSYANGKLFYQGRAGIDKTIMIPINQNTFRFDEVDFFRIQFLLDENGNTTGLKGMYDDGFEDFSQKNN